MEKTFYKILDQYDIPLDLAKVHTKITNKPTLEFEQGRVLYEAETCSEEVGTEFARIALPLLYTQKKHQQAPVAAAAALFSLGIPGTLAALQNPLGSPWSILEAEGNCVMVRGPNLDFRAADFYGVYHTFQEEFTPWLYEEYGINLWKNTIRIEFGKIAALPRVKVWAA